MAKGDVDLVLSGASARKATDIEFSGGRGGAYNAWSPGLPSTAVGHNRAGAGYSLVSGMLPAGVHIQYCRVNHAQATPVVATLQLRYERVGTTHYVKYYDGSAWQTLLTEVAADGSAANASAIASAATGVSGVTVRLCVELRPSELTAFSGSETSAAATISVSSAARATPEKWLQSGIVSPLIPAGGAFGNSWWPADFLPFGGFDLMKAWGLGADGSGVSIGFAVDTTAQSISVRMYASGNTETFSVSYASGVARPVFVGPVSRVYGAVFYIDPALIASTVAAGVLQSSGGSYTSGGLVASAEWYALPCYQEDYAGWGHRHPMYLHNPTSSAQTVTLRVSGAATPNTIYGGGYAEDTWYVGLGYISTDPEVALSGFYDGDPAYLSTYEWFGASLSFALPAGAYVPVWRSAGIGSSAPAPGTRGTTTLFVGG